MYLTREEQAILDGERGESASKAMELVTALGRIYGAEDLVDITSAHLSGASYKTVGDGGLKYFRDMAAGGARVSVKTSLNPVGMDRDRWKEMHISDDFAAKQREIIDLYGRMGVDTCCTCTPYLGANVPSLGDHVAWAESSALSFVNSYIGARTNREGGPGALAAAIVGKTANYGLHLDENRVPTVVIDVSGIQDTVFDYSVLGEAVGKAVGRGVPYFKGINPGTDKAKALCAAMAAAGSIALWHAEGCTPEAGRFDVSGLETVSIGREEMKAAEEGLQSSDDVQLLAIGCPHLSPDEIREIAGFLKGKEKKNDGVEIWFCTSAAARRECAREVSVLEKFGPVLADTCMVVAPIESSFSKTGTNSAKAANYLPTLCSQKVMFGSIPDLLKVVE